MSQLGRISGPLLKSNLIRNGVNLAFETDLLYLDVNNKRIGINVVDPLDITSALTVNGTTRTGTIDITSDTIDIGNINISGSTITSSSGTLTLAAAANGLVVYQSKLLVDDLKLENNVISTISSNSNLELRPHGTGTVEIFGDTNVTGNITATGNISADGNIQIGSTNQTIPNNDTVTFNARVNSDIIPDETNLRSLGSDTNRWENLWVKNVISETLSSGSIIIDGINVGQVQGNIFYVASEGDDTNAGEHQNDPFASVKKALTVASAGDTVYIYPGTYTEIFPLTVPAGVTIKGVGIRSVKIVPTAGTNIETAFLLNGETTIEDLTIADYYSPGYAFKFALGFVVTSRSPYIRNVSVITRGSTITPSDPLGFDSGDAGNGAFIDGSYADASSKEASMLFQSVTFICPNAEGIVATNGARVEWLNSFTYYANRGMFLTSGTAGFANTGKTRLKISNTTGTWAVGDTLSYYDTDGTTVLASGVIASIDGDFYNIAGRIMSSVSPTFPGFEAVTDRAHKTVVVHGNAKLSTAVKKFGSASLVLDGVEDYLTVPTQEDFEFGTGNFCVEMWVYRTGGNGTNQVLADFRSAAPQVVPTLFLSATNYHPSLIVNGVVVISGTTTVPLNTWTHIAVAKSGTSTKIFMNGSQQGSTYSDTNNYIQGALTIGARFDGTAGFYGNIDDVGVSKGTARYTTTFAVPTAQSTGDLSTILLLHLNGTDGSTAIADNGITLQDLRTSSGGTATLINFANYSDFGAEVRSIGSAAVYGNYGIWGEGAGVIAYLIGQNLAYIGNGGVTTNDPNTVNQANEIVEEFGAKIYYQSVDQNGDFRIGDLFYVNQVTGEVSFTNSDVTIGTSLTFDDGVGNITYLDATKIETGDFRISGNTIQTLTQDFNVSAASDLINLQSNVHITGNLDVVGNVTIGGNITIGDQTTDSVSFVAGVNSDILPTITSTYNLGSPSLQWKGVYATEADIGSIKIESNVITTIDSNSNLELRAHGAGLILVPSNNVQLDQDLTVNGTSYVKNVNITGTITQTGNVTQTGSLTQTGNINVTGTISVSGDAQFNDILISGNAVTTTVSNNDLNLSANGTGQVIVPTANVTISNNLTVNGLATIDTFVTNNTLTAGEFSTGDILISQNNITTTQSNSDLVLTANGNGQVTVPTSDVYLSQQLTVVGTTNTGDINIVGTVAQTGNILHTGNTAQTGNFTLTGNLSVGNTAQFTDIKIDNNVISTTTSNADLDLRANGTGRVLIPSNDVEVTNNLTVVGATTTTTLNNTGTVTSSTFSTGDISVTSNTVSTTVSNSNLELLAAGSGKIYVPNNNVRFGQALTVVGTSTLDDTNIIGTLTHVGATVQTGNTNQTGNFILTGNLTVGNTAQFKDINIDNNVVATTLLTDLELRASGTGRIYVPSNNVTIEQNLTVTGTTATSTINNSGTVTASTFSNGDITINGNTIRTTVTNSNLQLQAAGTGFIELEQFEIQDNTVRISASNTDMVLQPNGTGIVSINSTQALKLPVGNNTQRPTASAGMIRFNSELSRYEGYNGTTWVRLDGVEDADGNTKITAESTPGANDNTIRFYTNGAQVADLTSARFNINSMVAGNLNLSNNTISTTGLNQNLILAPSGTGSVRTGNFSFKDNTITNTVNNSITNINHTGNGYFKINSTGGFVIPAGLTEQRPVLFAVGMMRYNTDPGNFRVEIWDGSNWINAGQGAGGGVSVTEAEDIGILSAIIFG